MAVGRSYGIAKERASAAALKLLGYNRATAAMRSRCDGVAGKLLSDGRLEEEDGGLLVLTGS